MSLLVSARRLALGAASVIWLAVCVPAPAAAQSQPPQVHKGKGGTPATRKSGTANDQQPVKNTAANITGTVIDRTGAVAVGAKVQLTRDDPSQKQEVLSGENGEYSFSSPAPGPFHLTITAPGFDTQSFAGELKPGEAFVVPPIMLSVATAVTEVKVGVSPEEVAEIEVKQQEQQRVFGFIPNFYVTYTPDAPPLFAKQKFELAWKSVRDPVTLLGVAFLAGIDQAGDQPHGYGQGAEGYGKRFGTAYGDVLTGTFLGSALLPSLFHQDPRYFYQGTGSTRSRFVHALSNAVIAKGDNKQWQVNYSGILGSFAAGGISYTYTPARDRGVGLFLGNSLIRLGESSVAGILQEFVLRRFTSHVPADAPVHP